MSPADKVASREKRTVLQCALWPTFYFRVYSQPACLAEQTPHFTCEATVKYFMNRKTNFFARKSKTEDCFFQRCKILCVKLFQQITVADCFTPKFEQQLSTAPLTNIMLNL